MPKYRFDLKQGSTDWLEARSGIPTASRFSDIITPKGKPSASAERYMNTLIAERLMCHPCIEHISLWQQRGTEEEANAVSYYTFLRDIDTETVGFITNEAETIGASPDRLVGAKGLLEIKVPSEHVQIGFLRKSGSAFEAYRTQVLGQLWITEREWCDLLAWHPELPHAMIRIERDEKAISQLAEAVEEFSADLERTYLQIVESGIASAPTRKPKRTAQDDLLNAMRESLLEVKK